jgi:formamidopyrimidine-DNA glycosylase
LENVGREKFGLHGRVFRSAPQAATLARIRRSDPAMPELPEVEVSRRGIAPEVENRRIVGAIVRDPRLRLPVPANLPQTLAGLVADAVLRRGKYLLLRCRHAAGLRSGGVAGHLLIHLGMSGSLRFVTPGAPAAPHDHFDLLFDTQALRLRDPRRFGLVLWLPGDDPGAHPLLARLGPEPLAAGFDGPLLKRSLASRRQAIKPAIMDAGIVVGVGNIYASESLFHARISPRRVAGSLSLAACERLAAAIRDTLSAAIAAGGSSVRDYVHSDGGAGCFQLQCAVYDRENLPCPACGTPIRALRQAGRASYYCPRCQR